MNVLERLLRFLSAEYASLLVYAAVSAVFGLVGALIGSKRGRLGLGFLLGFIFGFLGWIVVAVLPARGRARRAAETAVLAASPGSPIAPR